MTNQWDQPNISVDVVPYVMDATTDTLNIALATREYEPAKGQKALPGVLMIGAERAVEAAERALKTKVHPDVKIKFLKDIGISDLPDRDSRGPSLTIIMLAVIELPALSEDSQISLVSAKEATNIQLPFDHHTLVERTNEYIDQNLLTNKEFTTSILGREFTTKTVYNALEEVHTGKFNSLDKSNLSRRLKTYGYVKGETDAETLTSTSGKGRPANLWHVK